MIIETVTKKLIINDIKPKRPAFEIDGSNVLLYFTDKVTIEVLNKLKSYYTVGLSIVVLTLDNTCPFVNSKIKIITVSKRWFIHTLFHNPYIFRMVSYDGFIAKTKAKAFSNFTGFKFSIVNNVIEAKEELRKVENAVLIKLLNGIGDLLMVLPTVKELNKKGYAVDLFVPQEKISVFKNITCINRIITDKKQVSASMYKNFYDLSLRVSQYSKPVCQKHRINVMADLCGVGSSTLDKQLTIILDEDEIDKGLDMIKKLDNKKPKLLVSLDSVDRRRTYPEKLQGKLIKLLSKYFYVILVSFNRQEFSNCLNLTKKTTIRELFSLAYLSDIVLSVDTSAVHIAGAFNKPCVMLPSTVNPNWRTYSETIVIPPKAKCYPCNERIGSDSLCENKDSCLNYIEQDDILNVLLKEATERDLF